MTNPAPDGFDPRLDLLLERVVEVPRDRVWRAWTVPQELMKWFTPDPWKTVECEIDLRPGGKFMTVMRSPEGSDHPNLGCYLEVVANERLTWTSTLLPGFRPAPADSSTCGDSTVHFHFTAVISLATVPQGTRYSAWVLHSDEAGRRQHESMGFQEGWGAALDQLVASIRGTR